MIEGMLNILKFILENDSIINGLFLALGSLITYMGMHFNKKQEIKKEKEKKELDKHLLFSNICLQTTLFLESFTRQNNFMSEEEEYIHYEEQAYEFLDYLDSIKGIKFDKKTTNILFEMYEYQRKSIDDIFIVEELITDGENTVTGYPETREIIYMNRNKKREYENNLRNRNNDLKAKLKAK